MDNQSIDTGMKWSRATLRIFSEMLQPNEIGEFLGIKATRIHLMGEPIPGQRSG